jgi:hypothetical protein
MSRFKLGLRLCLGLGIAWTVFGIILVKVLPSNPVHDIVTPTNYEAHYSDSGLPLMVCEYHESHGVVNHDQFTNCQAVRVLKRFETEPTTVPGQKLMYVPMNDLENDLRKGTENAQ